MKLLLFTLSSFVSLALFSQNEIKYLDINAAAIAPNTVEYLYLDCNTDNCARVFNQIRDYSSLKGIYISNYDDKISGKGIESLSELTSLTIDKSPQINLTKLFNSLSKNANLTYLSLKDNNLKKVPTNIKLLSSLSSINISNNDNLNLEKTILQLSSLKNLEELFLPVNSITELPDNINTLKNLKTLDISNNYLEDLPNGISEMRNLEELSLEGNFINDLSATLEKTKNISLKYIALDNTLTKKEKERLRELFPNAQIKEIDTSDPEDERIKTIIKSEKNEGDIEEIPLTGTIETYPTSNQVTKNINFGEIKVEEKKIKIYSQAYFHYPKVFGLQKPFIYDTTMFEERFLDTNYAYIYRRQLRINSESALGRIKLGKYKTSKNDDIQFSVNTLLSRTNMELMAFRGMKWVLVDNKNHDSFKKNLVYAKDYKWYKPSKWAYRNKWKFWTDARLAYNQDQLNFTLILKDLHGFTELTAYPIFHSVNRTLEDAQKTYAQRYSRYTKSLSRRKKKFERDNQRDKSRLEKSRKASDQKRWVSFQKNYMTDQEKKLSREEWLAYYDKVIANERKAMGNASASISNIERSINLDGFVKDYLWQNPNTRNSDSSLVSSVRTLYQDTDSNMLAIKRIIIINKENNTYQSYDGSLGIKTVRLNLIQWSNSVIIAQLRNDDIGYIKSNKYQKISFPRNGKYKFTLKTINTKFGTVQMLREELNF